MLRWLRKRGQNTAEYAILIALVIGAAVGMQAYLNRGLKSRMKGAFEYLINATNEITHANYVRQYEPPPSSDQQYLTTQTSGSKIKMGKGYFNMDTSATTVRSSGGFEATGPSTLNQDE